MNFLERLLIKLGMAAAKEMPQAGSVKKSDQTVTFEKNTEHTDQETIKSEEKPVPVSEKIQEPIVDYDEDDEEEVLMDPPDLTGYSEPSIFFPQREDAVSADVPSIELTPEEAVAEGFSFRRSKRSVRITNYHGCDKETLIIPSAIGGLPVTEIAPRSFFNGKVKELYIPGSVRKIANETFLNTSLRKVIIADGMTSIGDKAFYQCGYLEDIHFPLTLKHIGRYAFSMCSSLKTVSFPNSLKMVDEYAFFLSGIESFTIGSDKNNITNGRIFEDCPIIRNYDLVCNSSDKTSLSVIMVRPDSKIRLTAKKVHFHSHAFTGRSDIDISSCEDYSFARHAITERFIWNQKVTSPCFGSTIILPEVKNGCCGYWFTEGVKVYNYFAEPLMPYKPFRESTDNDGVTIIDIMPNFAPSYIVEDHHTKIYIHNLDDAEKYAVDCPEAEEAELNFWVAEGPVFSLRCMNLRKVRFYKDHVKYLPPRELVNPEIKRMLLLSFTFWSAPCSNDGHKRVFYNREPVDLMMTSRRISAYDNHYARKAIPVYDEAHSSVIISNKRKALIAVDVLRSTHLSHEPDTAIYSDFLKKHRHFCQRYFESISEKYPEYLHEFNKLMNADETA
ncbi:MAG: leucine-rich repeat domain-containing protein [Ruminococcus sp.]|nr:leucine-rich repeat domain-containing protein [Ruminococcus sp.]